jgi:hypothetical protein
LPTITNNRRTAEVPLWFALSVLIGTAGGNAAVDKIVQLGADGSIHGWFLIVGQ